MLGSAGLAFLAGLFSTLSPCVIPLLPIVLGAAATEHRFGAFALAIGVALSFVAIGLFVATVGFGIGLDGDVFRVIAALLMILIGIVLAISSLSARLAAAGGFVSNCFEQRFGGGGHAGLSGQFGVGLLLGAVWSPCVGPTLGAASVLAATGRNLGQVGLTMLIFGIGAALPLIVLGMLSRRALVGLRGRLLAAGSAAKVALGVILISIGMLIVTGADKRVEAALVEASPAWLTELTTRY